MSKRKHKPKEPKLKIECLYENKPTTIRELRRPDVMKFTLPGGGLYFIEYGKMLRGVDERITKLKQGGKL